MEREHLIIPLEAREIDGAPSLVGVVVQEGRAASGGRAELFSPGSTVWPSDGIGILTEHGGSIEARAIPTREANGEITIKTKATPAIREAFLTRKFMSVEFRSEKEVTTRGGVREIQRAMISAAALVRAPEYQQATAEIRKKKPRGLEVWL